MDRLASGKHHLSAPPKDVGSHGIPFSYDINGRLCCSILLTAGVDLPMDENPAGILELGLSQAYDPSYWDTEVLGPNPNEDVKPEVEDVDVESEITARGMKIKRVTIESSLGMVARGGPIGRCSLSQARSL